MSVLRLLDIFSGIGGASLGLHRTGGFETVAFCEIEPFPRKVLKKNFPGVPVFKDVRELHAEDLPEPIDVIWGSYPCQPFSVAGKQRGEDDDRHLWPEVIRLVRECKPQYVLCENVAGHIKLGLDTVLSDLESEGYATETFVIPACAVNAPHRRDRVWIIAYPEHDGQSPLQKSRVKRQTILNNEKRKAEAGEPARVCIPPDVAYPNSERLQGQQKRRSHGEVWPKPNNKQSTGCDSPHINRPRQSPLERRVCQGDDGISGGVVRRLKKPKSCPVIKKGNTPKNNTAMLKALGNTVMPQIVEILGYAVLEHYCE